MNCTICREPVQHEWHFCRWCGTALASGASATVVAKKSAFDAIFNSLPFNARSALPFGEADTKPELSAAPNSFKKEDLAGTWVGDESSLSGGIYMRYTQYLSLHPDGTVGWDKSEGGAALTPERFSSFRNSRTGNQGTWGQWSTDGRDVLIHWKDSRTWRGQVAHDARRITFFGVGSIEQGSDVIFERK